LAAAGSSSGGEAVELAQFGMAGNRGDSYQ
jgi:hypothetical protein